MHPAHACTLKLPCIVYAALTYLCRYYIVIVDAAANVVTNSEPNVQVSSMTGDNLQTILTIETITLAASCCVHTAQAARQHP